MWEWPAKTRTTDFPTEFSCCLGGVYGKYPERKGVQGLLMQVSVPTRHWFVHLISMRHSKNGQIWETELELEGKAGEGMSFGPCLPPKCLELLYREISIAWN